MPSIGRAPGISVVFCVPQKSRTPIPFYCCIVTGFEQERDCVGLVCSQLWLVGQFEGAALSLYVGGEGSGLIAIAYNKSFASQEGYS
jgi:hypothetical protein